MHVSSVAFAIYDASAFPSHAWLGRPHSPHECSDDDSNTKYCVVQYMRGNSRFDVGLVSREEVTASQRSVRVDCACRVWVGVRVVEGAEPLDWELRLGTRIRLLYRGEV